MLQKVYCLLFLVASCWGKSYPNLPTFSWVEEEAPFGVPLLRIKFPDGGNDDFAVLKAFNPVPIGPNERAETVDSCIYEGYLLNEKNVHVTLTGCPSSNNLQLQFSSARLDHDMFKVTQGVTRGLVHSHVGLLKDYVNDDEYTFTGILGRETTPLSSNGYITNLKLNYDDNFSEKFGSDAVNAVRRIMAHAQHVWKWPSLTTKVIFNVSSVVTQVSGRWNAASSLSEACTAYNVNYASTGIHSSVYFALENVNSSSTQGVAYKGGACSSTNKYHCALIEFEEDDIVCGRVLAHELGHNHGMPHDFTDDANDPTQYDNEGNSCSDVGGIMDYTGGTVGDKRQWSTCSVEAFTALVNQYPKCFKEIDPQNPPAQIADAVLTKNECDLTNQEPDNGYNNLYLNGKQCRIMCIDNMCAPKPGNCGDSNQTACERICGQSSCSDAVQPSPCDLSAQLGEDYTGSTSVNLNGYKNKVNCDNGQCYPDVDQFTNACQTLCGADSCTDAVDPGTCDLGITEKVNKWVCYNKVKSSVRCNKGVCTLYKDASEIGGYTNTCTKICGATDCSTIKKC